MRCLLDGGLPRDSAGPQVSAEASRSLAEWKSRVEDLVLYGIGVHLAGLDSG